MDDTNIKIAHYCAGIALITMLTLAFTLQHHFLFNNFSFPAAALIGVGYFFVGGLLAAVWFISYLFIINTPEWRGVRSDALGFAKFCLRPVRMVAAGWVMAREVRK